MLVRLVRSALSPWALSLCFVVACLFAAAPASAQDPDAAPAAAAPAAAAPATETPAAAAPAAGAPKELSDKEKKRLELENESVLAYYYRSLGVLYTVVFLALSFTFVALVILNGLALRKSAIMPDALVQNFEAALNEKNYQGAYEMAKSDDSFLGAVLAAGMSKLQSGYDAAEEAMNEAGSDESMKLEHRLSYIALIGSLAPMVGLLGTVDGMIASFRVIEKSGTTPEPAALAGGISTALITTIVGLWLAIPAIAMFGIYKNRLARLLYDCGAVSESLMGRFQAVKK
ncbi:MAG: MotA/TolQ/ExbB proton channel family protein [Planctomycetales bacterium]|nr:MotA/TolQ/ExbB proton channel family protein [Planctomycetales bacterium]MBN8628282.1 MotA/TolQ/ExbB proton channel family protein [Planctomycetota bacterium]